MPTTEQLREELFSIFQEAVEEKRSTVEVSAGELHRGASANTPAQITRCRCAARLCGKHLTQGRGMSSERQGCQADHQVRASTAHTTGD